MERLLDLAHDLGKYLRLPLTMLPPSADQAQLRTALQMALLQTRRKQGQSVSARELWGGFRQELAPAFEGQPAFVALEAAVARALAWEDALSGARPLDRAAAERDLRAVGDAIERLIEAAPRGPR